MTNAELQVVGIGIVCGAFAVIAIVLLIQTLRNGVPVVDPTLFINPPNPDDPTPYRGSQLSNEKIRALLSQKGACWVDPTCLLQPPEGYYQRENKKRKDRQNAAS